MAKKKAEEIQEYDLFQCQACEDKPEFERKELAEHMSSVHGITEMKGTRQMVSHYDGQKHYGGQNKWNIGGIEIYEAYQHKRSKEDMMYWS